MTDPGHEYEPVDEPAVFRFPEPIPPLEGVVAEKPAELPIDWSGFEDVEMCPKRTKARKAWLRSQKRRARSKGFQMIYDLFGFK